MSNLTLSVCVITAGLYLAVPSPSGANDPLSVFRTGGVVEGTAAIDTGKYVVILPDAPSPVSIGISGDSTGAHVPFIPKTKHGKMLWEAVQEIVESGEPLFDARELLSDLAASRGR